MRELKYWYFLRPKEKATRWIAWHLPREIRKWVLVRAAVEVKNETAPGDVNYSQMFKTVQENR